MGAEADLSRRTVLLHGGVYAASRVLNQGASFLLLPVYAHVLGPVGMGIVEMFNVARTLFGVLVAQGLDGAWFRLRFDVQGKDRLAAFESTLVWYLVVAGLAVVGVVSALGGFIGSWLTPGVDFLPLGAWTAATSASTVLAVLVERRLQAEQRSLAFAAWTSARAGATLAAILWAVVVLRAGAAGKIQGEALVSLAFAVVALAWLRPRMTLDSGVLRRSLAYGLPIVPHTLAGVMNDILDRFVVNALLGVQAVGIYSMGYRIGSAGLIVTIAVNQAFSPMFIQTLRSAERAEGEGRPDHGVALRKRVATIAFFMVAIATGTAQLLTAFARELLAIGTTPEFADSWRVVAPVCAGAISWSWYLALAQGIVYRPDRIRRLPILTGTAAATNLALNYLLVPRLGIQGAAVATFLSNTGLALSATWMGTRSVSLPYQWGRWLLVVGFGLASLVVLYALDTTLETMQLRIAAKSTWVLVSLGVTAKLSGMNARALLDTWRSRRARKGVAPGLDEPTHSD